MAAGFIGQSQGSCEGNLCFQLRVLSLLLLTYFIYLFIIFVL